MIEFIYGPEEYLINQEINKISNLYKSTLITYFENDPLEKIILDIKTVSMFDETKLIYIKNHYSLFENNDFSKFIKTLSFLDEKVKVIFSLETNSLSKKNELIKFLLKKANCKKIEKINSKNIILIIKKIVFLKKGIISDDAAKYLSKKLPLELRLIIFEIDKLLFENNKITKEMIDKSIGEYFVDDFFELTNAFVSNNALDLIKSYNKNKKIGIDTNQIISQINSILSLSLFVDNLKKQGFTNFEISKKMNVHIFRVKNALELIKNSKTNIEDLIKKLFKLDFDIKTGKIDSKQGIEYFLLQSIK